jgi:hypothetical protein
MLPIFGYPGFALDDAGFFSLDYTGMARAFQVHLVTLPRAATLEAFI